MGRINPIRYRGYYYDEETGLYYLQSRYYDPIVGRFLNADGIIGANRMVEDTNYNLFAYCMNNPINFGDMTGTRVYYYAETVNATFIWGVSINVIHAIDTQGNVAKLVSFSGFGIDQPYCGILDAGLGYAVGCYWDDAATVYDLAGEGTYFGASGGAKWYAGGDLLYFNNTGDGAPDGIQITGGVGIGVDIHVGVSKTYLVEVTNIPEKISEIQQFFNSLKSPKKKTTVTKPSTKNKTSLKKGTFMGQKGHYIDMGGSGKMWVPD